MTKKQEPEASKEGPGLPYDVEAVYGDGLRRRQLAEIAGHVAAGLIVSPSPRTNSADKMATVAVDIADAILRKLGL